MSYSKLSNSLNFCYDIWKLLSVYVFFSIGIACDEISASSIPTSSKPSVSRTQSGLGSAALSKIFFRHSVGRFDFFSTKDLRCLLRIRPLKRSAT